MSVLDNHACEAGETFVNIFYKTMDKSRHLIGKLYEENATLIWNGHEVTGQDAILKFYEGLPSSEHTIDAIDSHAVANVAVGDKNTIIVTMNGVVRYQKNRLKTITQTFILIAQEQGKQSWKIISDCLRTSE